MANASSIESAIGRLGGLQEYSAGALLFQAGDKSEAFYRIESGTVRISRTDERGRELEIARLGPGDFLGEAVALAGSPYPFSAEAVTDIVVRRFEGKDVEERSPRNPRRRSFPSNCWPGNVSCSAAGWRVSACGLSGSGWPNIFFKAARAGRPGCASSVLSIKKSELAGHLGTVGETLSRTLQGDGPGTV